MLPAEVELTRAYLRWCERTGRKGDCLRLLVDSPAVTGDGRYTLAMAFAQGVVREEMLDAFRDMADPHAALSAALWTMTLYLVLWSVPEPVSKGLAAVMTATAIVYLGVDTFWTLIAGFKRLVEEADRATTLDELREAGERYGKVMGQNAARAFALLATVAMGHTAVGFASTVPTLPGSAQAAAEGHDHHIATNKWWKSTNNDGPWSPQFQKLFDMAGMTLDDPANIVRVRGHQGPHPKEYHQRIFQRLTGATRGCRTMQQCREALTAELHKVGQEIATPGTRLNRLVTGT